MPFPTLLVIDVQEGLDNPALGERSTPEAEANIAKLLKHWRGQSWPVVHVKHNSDEPQSWLRPELPGNAIKPEAAPLEGEPLFEKTVHSAFIGTGLEQHLRDQGAGHLVVVGLTTEHCVSTSVRMACDLGFKVTLVSDATGAFEKKSADGPAYTAEQVHLINLATLRDEFAEIKTTDEVVGVS